MRISGDVAEDIVKEQGIKSKGQDFFCVRAIPTTGDGSAFFFCKFGRDV